MLLLKIQFFWDDTMQTCTQFPTFGGACVHLLCGPGRDVYSKVHKYVDTYTSMGTLLHTRKCVLGQHHCENTKPHISICSYETVFIRIERTSTKTFEFLDNIIKCYSVDGDILSDKLTVQFMNISKCYKLKSCETVRFLVARKRKRN